MMVVGGVRCEEGVDVVELGLWGCVIRPATALARLGLRLHEVDLDNYIFEQIPTFPCLHDLEEYGPTAAIVNMPV